MSEAPEKRIQLEGDDLHTMRSHMKDAEAHLKKAGRMIHAVLHGASDAEPRFKRATYTFNNDKLGMIDEDGNEIIYEDPPGVCRLPNKSGDL